MNSSDRAELSALRTRRIISLVFFEMAFIVPLMLLFLFEVIPLMIFMIGIVVLTISFAALLYLMVIRPVSAAGQQVVTDAKAEVPGATGTTGSTRDGYDPMKKYR
ncbi:hypothetical protein EDD31_2890 [Bogoriella caseilytica]|uniref:Uncharacterized protein n=2 Tax=Bogoriella caseilytica TaxID=56055 RepID=A0A3N2BHC2_9MICO|nr:hypothetical protein EDD31_2890 [Bogoriella caseilytica]